MSSPGQQAPARRGADRRALALLWAGVALALIALSPAAAALAAVAPACPVRAGLDLPCPGCGTARAALALARFDPAAALGFNPLAALGWIGLVGGGLAAGGAAVVGRPLPEVRLRPTPPARLALALALLLNWLYLLLAGI